MELKPCRIVVAGATGLTGAAIVKFILENHPHATVVGTHFATSPFFIHPRLTYVRADLSSKDDCRIALDNCDYFIMSARKGAGAGSAKTEPHHQVTENVIMDTTVLEACYLQKVKKVVYISSACVYQEFDGFIREDQLDLNKEPHQAYFGVAWAYRFTEKLCEFWHKKFGMEIIVLRAANVYGPYGKFDPSRSNFIPALIRKAVDRMDPFEVWGTPDVVRDVIYCEDSARAVFDSIFKADIKFDIFNLGTNQKTRVGDVVDFALKAAGHKPTKVVYASDKPTTIPFRALDCGKLRHAAGWNPVFSLEEGIRRTTDWWKGSRETWKK